MVLLIWIEEKIINNADIGLMLIQKMILFHKLKLSYGLYIFSTIEGKCSDLLKI